MLLHAYIFFWYELGPCLFNSQADDFFHLFQWPSHARPSSNGSAGFTSLNQPLRLSNSEWQGNPNDMSRSTYQTQDSLFDNAAGFA